ncbi:MULTISPECIES: hypothetical protein [Metallibacterium]|uniref:hypothetical protein n=1 Tax=Metallibacterium TaxID=1218803 RepID=UPI00261C222D|nr:MULTISPECIES: hypothetical protein [Metallibacterium]MBW8075273.1 hypothetical protein [Metallibacterium scheffleri]
MLEQEIFRALQARFDGQLTVTPGEALLATPTKSIQDPAGAARLQIHRGTFPYATLKIGGRRLVSVAEIARVLAGGEPASCAASISEEKPARGKKRGAPRKTRPAANAGAPAAATAAVAEVRHG